MTSISNKAYAQLLALAYEAQDWSTVEQCAGLTGKTPESHQHDDSLQRAAMRQLLPSARTAPQWPHP